ncbi:MAG: lamin tail domain-containing protein, partial [Deltaproteobacteria bacterium]|nr:lamin tail domain-containing protein [Deltaproteobacteria bacterium]
MKFHPTWTTLLLLTLLAAVLSGCSDDGKGGTDLGSGDQPALDLPGDVPADSDSSAADSPVDTPAQEMSSQQFQLPGDPCVPPTSILVINEIMVDPNVVSDLYGEWIEIYNPQAAPVNIGGFKLEDNSGSHTLPSVNIPSGGYFVICRNSDPGVNGGVTCNHQWSGGIALANTGDVVRLRQADNSMIDEVYWTTTAPVGKSFGLKNSHLNNSDTSNGNWAHSSSPYGSGDKGTPGAKNTDVYTAVDDAECADGNICTNDFCDLGVCKNPWKQGCCLTNADCNDNDICTSDVCFTQTNTCTHSPITNCCTTDAQCADNNPCNMDVCLNKECRHTAYNVIPGCCWA